MLPFNKRSILDRYCRGNIPFPKSSLSRYGVSEDGCGFIENLMQPEATKRPNPAEAHNHRWLQLGTRAAVAASTGSTDIAEIETTPYTPSIQFSYPGGGTTAFQEFDWKQWIMDHIMARDIKIDSLRQDDNIGRYATAAEEMYNSLIMEEPYPCPGEIARDLSLLVLYDLVMLIGIISKEP